MIYSQSYTYACMITIIFNFHLFLILLCVTVVYVMTRLPLTYFVYLSFYPLNDQPMWVLNFTVAFGFLHTIGNALQFYSPTTLLYVESSLLLGTTYVIVRQGQRRSLLTLLNLCQLGHRELTIQIIHPLTNYKYSCTE